MWKTNSSPLAPGIFLQNMHVATLLVSTLKSELFTGPIIELIWQISLKTTMPIRRPQHPQAAMDLSDS